MLASRRAAAGLLPAPARRARARPPRRGSPCSRARDRRRASSAQSVAGRPAKPTTAFRTTSGSARSSSSVRSPPTCVRGARPSTDCEPEAAATSSSSGCAAMISIAWRPIEPGRSEERRLASRAPVYGAVVALRLGARGRRSTRPGTRRGSRRSGRARLRARQQPPGVLDAQIALEHRLEEVAERSGQRDGDAEEERLADREERLAVLVERRRRRRGSRPAVPKTKPSHVLPGEIAGASLCRPSARPPKYAAVSSAKIASSTASATTKPNSGVSRSRSTQPSPKPIHAVPSSVTPTDDRRRALRRRRAP